MKSVNINKQVIIAPLIALLALICGSAFANGEFISATQRIQIDARQTVAESISDNLKQLRSDIPSKANISVSIQAPEIEE